MWSRELLKTRAKANLKLSYWKAFLVSIVIALVGGGIGGQPFNWTFGGNESQNSFDSFSGSDGELLIILLIAFLVFLIIASMVAAFRIFLGYPLEVGGRRFFTQAAKNDIDMNYLGYAFEKGKYISIIKAMLWKGFINFLWFLLLIIPGFIKAYAYSLVPYILADNPQIGSKRALELSTDMTRGEKFDMFILDLSFIGWYILGTIALFIGVLFVMPYQNATKAELYLVLRQKAIEEGLCTSEELGG